MSNTAPNRLKQQAELGSIGAYFFLKPRVMSLAIFTALCGQDFSFTIKSYSSSLFLVSLLSIAIGRGSRMYQYVV